MPQRDLLTTGEAGQLLSRSSRTVVRLIEAGELTALGKLGGVNGPYVLDRNEVERYRRQRAAATAATTPTG